MRSIRILGWHDRTIPANTEFDRFRAISNCDASGQDSGRKLRSHGCISGLKPTLRRCSLTKSSYSTTAIGASGLMISGAPPSGWHMRANPTRSSRKLLPRLEYKRRLIPAASSSGSSGRATYASGFRRIRTSSPDKSAARPVLPKYGRAG